MQPIKDYHIEIYMMAYRIMYTPSNKETKLCIQKAQANIEEQFEAQIHWLKQKINNLQKQKTIMFNYSYEDQSQLRLIIIQNSSTNTKINETTKALI